MDEPKRSWLDAMFESGSVQKKIQEFKDSLGPDYAPSLIFDFDHVMAVIGIVEAAIAETQTLADDESRSRALAGVQKAGEAALTGQRFSFVEEGLFTGMRAGLWNVNWTFPMILRRALFAAVCSHTEHVLRRWCHHLHVRWGIAVKLGRSKDRKSDLQNCMEYLRDEVKLAIDGFQRWPEWATIDANRLVRNLLAHDGGIVGELRDEDWAKIARLSYVELDTSGLVSDEPMVNILPGAPEAASQAAKVFFEKLAAICGVDPRAKTSV